MSVNQAPPQQPPTITPQGPTPPLFKRRRIKAWQWVLIGVGVLVVLGIVGSMVNSRSTPSTSTNPTAASHPTTAPAPTATKVPATATAVPKQWVTVQHFTGTQNTQTPTFHLADGDRIVWTATPTDTTANAFSIELYSSDGSLMDLVANTANLTKAETSTYNVHGSSDVYLKISPLYVSYDITVQTYR